MAVKSSGSISILNDIVAEFGGTAPHSLSEYYGGAGLVPAGANPSVPASGQIRFSNMYGSVAATVLSYLSNTNNVNIATDVVSAGGDLNTPVILTIGSGVTIGSTSSSTPAMTTGTGWGSGTTINITNNGSIVGASGTTSSSSYRQGGNGGSYNSGSGGSGTSGSSGTAQSENNGGDAFYHAQTGSDLSVIFDTAGTRTGGSASYTPYKGGGGGGGGGGVNVGNNWSEYAGGGGGGGAGSPAGSGGSGGGAGMAKNSSGGSSGSLTGGGSGGAGANTGSSWICAYWQSNGGNGGSNGNSGSNGQNGQRCSTHPSGYGTYTGGSGGGGGSNYNAYGSSGSALGGNTSQIS